MVMEADIANLKLDTSFDENQIDFEKTRLESAENSQMMKEEDEN